MKVYLAVAVPFSRNATAVPSFEELANRDRFRVHSLTDNPQTADIILFVDPHQHSDWRLRAIRRHPLALKYPEKVFVYDERDRPSCFLPGLYVSMPANAINLRFQRACGYHRTIHTQFDGADHQPDLLFSFMGSYTHPIRQRIYQSKHPRGYIEDSSHVNFFDFSGNTKEETIHRQKDKFAEIVIRSKFVLCPRGSGVSSIRMLETMLAGRVPVVISDGWFPPEGPDWTSCIIRVSEAEIEKIPALLEANEYRYESMAASAREAYANWFAPEVMFHRFVESCQELVEVRGKKPTESPPAFTAFHIHEAAFRAKAFAKGKLVYLSNRVLKRGAA